jgi:hypothetical protein
MCAYKLEFEYDYDFFLIGIFCHYKDYRLAWSINENTDIEFKRIDDYEIEIKNTQQQFSMFSFYVDSQDLSYYLINNRSEYGYLIPEKKDVDYFLMVDGLVERSKKDSLISEIRQLSEVLSATEIIPTELSSRQNLIID